MPEEAGRAAVGLVSDGIRLASHLARPPGSIARGGVRSGLVIAHDLPSGDGAGPAASLTFPELADRVARDTGWLALSFGFRGAGRSAGTFSPGGWLRDLVAAVEHVRPEVSSVFVAGFGFGGALALRVAALDPDIGGVAALGTASDLGACAEDVDALAAVAEESGYPTPEPSQRSGWAADLRAIDPAAAAAAIPPRPLLIVHGSMDTDTPLVEARILAEAAEGAAELRVIPMAGHRLRHDPRAVALLLGWLQRHG
jgi:hypothetical protein